MIYKLLAINIDGTLLQSNGRFSKAAKEAIEYVQAKDVVIVLVTSRNYQLGKKVAKALKINPMIVAAQGAYVATAVDKPLYIRKISKKTTVDFVRILEEMECQIKLNYEESEVRNRVNLPENLLSKAVMYVSEQKMFAQNYVDSISEYVKTHDSQPLSIEVNFQSNKAQQELISVARNMFDDITVVSKENHRIIIVPENVSKWKGIQTLANHLKIATREIVAIGDSKDDETMIAGAGVGVAMGNAPQEIKRVADWITRGNDDDGVAYMVKELFRKQYQLQFLEKLNLLK
ncbi:Cof-type HAD-IIB family hydrolase [Bacillus massiliigorillae]|uniref:Cof-type HAD-IIB family hydrolase n=1 Tax=Bacillus massiliigorillae TaxID=1243664 RepID=UPI0003AA3505|nr:Cof-type HAD-IIB family hydrolase [Bacillus massiliigorillae]